MQVDLFFYPQTTQRMVPSVGHEPKKEALIKPISDILSSRPRAALQLPVEPRGERDLQLHAERFGQSDGPQRHRLEVGSESERDAAQLSGSPHQFLLRLLGNR